MTPVACPAILFELDGVLVDTASVRAESLATAFADHGGVLPGMLDAARATESFDEWTRAVVEACARAGDTSAAALDETAVALIALRAEREFERRLAAGVSLVEGARALIDQLGADVRLAAVTSWRRDVAERTLALAGLEARVRFVVAGDDGGAPRGAVSRYGRAVARLRGGATRAPSAVIALVSSAEAVAAAHAAGAHTVLVGANPAAENPPPHAHLTALRELTRARLATWLDRTPPTAGIPLFRPDERS